jgi:catalase
LTTSASLERIVHARGSGARGFLEVSQSLSQYTKADFLQHVGEKTPVFARFSTVAGGAGSGDLARDVRGFSTKCYTGKEILISSVTISRFSSSRTR